MTYGNELLSQIKFFATGEKIQKKGVKLKGFVGGFDLEFYRLKNTFEEYFFALDLYFMRGDIKNLLAIDSAGRLVWMNPRTILKNARAKNNAKGIKIKGV
jgi:hypothetical protein|nr:MAG TPA: hypothetical protein [Caudoviricetes sp.]